MNTLRSWGAKELGLKFDSDRPDLNNALEQLTAGKITLEDIEAYVYSSKYIESAKTGDGKSAMDVYTQQGKDLVEAKNKTNNSDKKDEKK